MRERALEAHPTHSRVARVWGLVRGFIQQRHESAAEVFSASYRRQTFDAHSQELGKRLGFGVTDGGELARDMPHRAMPLTELKAWGRQARCGQARACRGRCWCRCRCGHTVIDRPNGCREPVCREGGRECLSACGDGITRRGYPCGIALNQHRSAFACELCHGIRPGMIGKKSEGRSREVVVMVLETGVASGRQYIRPCGTPTSATVHLAPGRLIFLDGVLLGQRIQMPSNSCRGQAQTGGEVSRGDGSILGERVPNQVSRCGRRVRPVCRIY